MCGEYADRQNMPNRGPRLRRLVAQGVAVRFFRGDRRLHQKSMLADATLYIGSMNFSEASRANEERGVFLELTSTGVGAELAAFDALWEQGRSN